MNTRERAPFMDHAESLAKLVSIPSDQLDVFTSQMIEHINTAWARGKHWRDTSNSELEALVASFSSVISAADLLIGAIEQLDERARGWIDELDPAILDDSAPSAEAAIQAAANLRGLSAVARDVATGAIPETRVGSPIKEPGRPQFTAGDQLVCLIYQTVLYCGGVARFNKNNGQGPFGELLRVLGSLRIVPPGLIPASHSRVYRLQQVVDRNYSSR